MRSLFCVIFIIVVTVPALSKSLPEGVTKKNYSVSVVSPKPEETRKGTITIDNLVIEYEKEILDNNISRKKSLFDDNEIDVAGIVRESIKIQCADSDEVYPFLFTYSFSGTITVKKGSRSSTIIPQESISANYTDGQNRDIVVSVQNTNALKGSITINGDSFRIKEKIRFFSLKKITSNVRQFSITRKKTVLVSVVDNGDGFTVYLRNDLDDSLKKTMAAVVASILAHDYFKNAEFEDPSDLPEHGSDAKK